MKIDDVNANPTLATEELKVVARLKQKIHEVLDELPPSPIRHTHPSDRGIRGQMGLQCSLFWSMATTLLERLISPRRKSAKVPRSIVKLRLQSAAVRLEQDNDLGGSLIPTVVLKSILAATLLRTLYVLDILGRKRLRNPARFC